MKKWDLEKSSRYVESKVELISMNGAAWVVAVWTRQITFIFKINLF